MKKLYVVKKSSEFEKIIKTGQLTKNKSFIIYYRDNNLKYSRFGISVGKKLGNAVFRNKYKRKIREIINSSKKLYINNRDYIIILRGMKKDKEYQELLEDFQSAIIKVRKEKI